MSRPVAIRDVGTGSGTSPPTLDSMEIIEPQPGQESVLGLSPPAPRGAGGGAGARRVCGPGGGELRSGRTGSRDEPSPRLLRSPRRCRLRCTRAQFDDHLLRIQGPGFLLHAPGRGPDVERRRLDLSRALARLRVAPGNGRLLPRPCRRLLRRRRASQRRRPATSTAAGSPAPWSAPSKEPPAPAAGNWERGSLRVSRRACRRTPARRGSTWR